MGESFLSIEEPCVTSNPSISFPSPLYVTIVCVFSVLPASVKKCPVPKNLYPLSRLPYKVVALLFLKSVLIDLPASSFLVPIYKSVIVRPPVFTPK